MIFNSDDEALVVLKANLAITPDFQTMRENSKELKALVNGTGFIDELICKIEGIEAAAKAKARKDYSRSVVDTFARLFQPISNIYYASGGVKDFDIKNKATKKAFLNKIANIRDGKPLSEWVQNYAIKLLNTDPNGLIFLEYKTAPTLDVYPTYKSINAVRFYKSKGQLLEFVIFEPKQVILTGQDKPTTLWRIVDDLTDRTFKQDGETFTIVEERTFEHPFGTVPALICSNIVVLGCEVREPAIQTVLGLAREIARDQSFLTLYKIFKANPIFWRYVQYCGSCNGTGKDDKGSCSECNGVGKIVTKSDVTDAVELPLPEDKDSPNIAPNIAGYISPDLDVWTKFEETLEAEERRLYATHWGTQYGMQSGSGKLADGQKTATEVTADKQPLENQLNLYADYAEFTEWQLCEWILNLLDPTKKKDESRTTINLGRRYAIESYDVLLQRYEDSKKAGENSVVLDKLFSEYLVSKYRNNPIDLQINLIKAQVEPYIHLTITEVNSIFGNLEAQRKVLFQQFWQTLTEYSDTEAIREAFKVWFEENKKDGPAKDPAATK